MNENILKYFQTILLSENRRFRDGHGVFHDVYVQPERLSSEDISYESLQDYVNKNPHAIFGASVSDSLNSTNK